ncbi:MAG: metallophosphoesterase [Spirochaetes bacterium]|nr:metallophosphoesterase [Spirochaetota bacterium]
MYNYIEEVKILLIADTHLGFDLPQRQKISIRRRGEDFFSNYQLALKHGIEENVDLIVHGGDIFYKSQVPQAIIIKAFQPLLTIADRGIPIFIVPGNHERARIPESLFTQHQNIKIFDQPKTFPLMVKGKNISLSGFPYYYEGVRSNFLNLLAKTGYQDYQTDLKLLCVHHVFEGAQVGKNNYTFRSASDVVKINEVPTDFQAVLTGHIHRYQILRKDLEGNDVPVPVYYPGSIERTSVQEAYERKGFIILKIKFFKHKPKIQHSFFQLPARPMKEITLSLAGKTPEDVTQELMGLLVRENPHSIVYLRLADKILPKYQPIFSADNLRKISPDTMNVRLTVSHYKHFAR